MSTVAAQNGRKRTALTHYGRIVSSEGAYARRAVGHGELAEAPVAGQVLLQEGGVGQGGLSVQLRVFQAEHVHRAVVGGDA